MKCPWSNGEEIKYCTAIKGIVAVSVYEIKQYCGNSNYINCPIFVKRAKSKRILSIDNYLAIFLEEEEKWALRELSANEG